MNTAIARNGHAGLLNGIYFADIDMNVTCFNTDNIDTGYI